MTRTITLPVKCSTVKRLHEQLQNIGFSVSVVYAIVSVIYAWNIINHKQVAVRSHYEHILLGFTMGGLFWFMLLLIVTLLIIVDNIPRLECIKDEEDEP